MRVKKGEIDMTDTLTNITEIFDTYEVKKRETPKLDALVNFIKLKSIANGQEELISQYIVKDKKIRNGRPVIKGTRITPCELLIIVQESFETKPTDINKMVEYIKEQYPSIDSIEKIVAGLSYAIKQLSTLKFIGRTLFRNT